MPVSTHTLYPSAADVRAFLEGAGIPLSVALTNLLDEIAEAGVAQFERRTGRKMLAEPAPTLRIFDPPANGSNTLWLPYDLAAAPTACAYQPQGATSETLTSGTDYVLLPHNAPSLVPAEPYTEIRLANPRVYGYPALSQAGSIRITGKWGYATAIPSDAYVGMVRLGLAELWGEITQAATGGLLSWSEGDVKEDYGVERWSTLRDAWQMAGDRAVKRYKRLSF